jgi:hypothetical protein
VPIKPENRDRYPADWPEIRARIRDRAGDKCEVCGVPNGAFGYRDQDGDFVKLEAANEVHEFEQYYMDCEHLAPKLITIVCTVAHLDHNPENCADENLAFMCQKDHNSHDAEHRAQTRATTKRTKLEAAGQTGLFKCTERGVL